MGVADGDGFAFFARAAERQFELFAHCGNFGDIIEERNIAKAGAHAVALGGVKRNGGRCCAAVDIEELAFAQERH